MDPRGRRPRWLQRSRAAMRIAAIVLALSMGAYAAVLGAIYWRQEAILFQPAVLPPSHRFAIVDTREVRIQVDGATLSALHLRLPHPKGFVFFLHGNGGNLATWFTNPAFYRSVNYDLFMIDYRGYGKSTGHIESEAQLRADRAPGVGLGGAALRWQAQRHLWTLAGQRPGGWTCR